MLRLRDVSRVMSNAHIVLMDVEILGHVDNLQNLTCPSDEMIESVT